MISGISAAPGLTSNPLADEIQDDVKVVLTCTPIAGTPAAYKWEKDNGVIDGQTANTYTILSFSSEDHAGTYYCYTVASNGATSDPSEGWKLSG